MPPAVAVLTPHRRMLGTERTNVTQDCIDQFEAGPAIRSITVDHGRCYGVVHCIPTQAGVRLGPRGGRPQRKWHQTS